MTVGHRFLPILNYNFGPSVTKQEAQIIYAKSITLLLKYFDQIEVSCASDYFWENFDFIAKFDTQIAYGSIVSEALAYKLLQRIPKGAKIFAPAYDPFIERLLVDYEYIPGVFLEEDLCEVSNYSSIKIYPFDTANFINSLSAPYPEFRKEFYLNKSSDKNLSKAYVCRSPRDYQKIRQKFLEDPDFFVCFDIKQKNCHQLASKITQIKYISRIKIKDCFYPNSIVASRVFANIDFDKPYENLLEDEMASILSECL